MADPTALYSNYSGCFCVHCDTDSMPDSFKDLTKEFKNSIACTDTPEGVVTSTQNIQEITNDFIREGRCTLNETLSLISNDKLCEYLTLCQKSLEKGTPPPLIKLYLYYGSGKGDSPFGINLFILPPGCTSPIHNHQPDGKSCTSFVLHGSIEEHHYLNHKDGKLAYRYETLSRQRGINDTWMKCGSPLGESDTHSLDASLTSDRLQDFIALLKEYAQNRTNRINDPDGLVATSLHPYIGIDPERVPSSVKRCDFVESESSLIPFGTPPPDSIGARVHLRHQLRALETTYTTRSRDPSTP